MNITQQKIHKVETLKFIQCPCRLLLVLQSEYTSQKVLDSPKCPSNVLYLQQSVLCLCGGRRKSELGAGSLKYPDSSDVQTLNSPLLPLVFTANVPTDTREAFPIRKQQQQLDAVLHLFFLLCRSILFLFTIMS